MNLTFNGVTWAVLSSLTISSITTNAYAKEADVERNEKLKDIEVLSIEGERVRTYRAESASAATLLSLPLEETPFNIGIITEDLIDDRQIDDLDDAVLLNASVTRNRSHSDNSPNYNIRGFTLDGDRLGYLVNGMPVAATDAPPAHASALTQIEVLKGTAALFYGAGEPAGVINYVYKKPLENAQYSVQTTVGDNDELRGELDLTGPISDTLLYRFTLGWEDSKGVVNYDYSKDFAPTLQLLWQPSENTSVRFIGEYVEHKGNPIAANVAFLDGAYLEGPKEQYFGFSTDFEEQDSKGFQLQGEHKFSDDVKLVLQAGMKDSGKDIGNSGYLAFLPMTIPGFSDVENGIALRSTFDQRRRAESEYLAGHVAWSLSTGEVDHQFVIGANYSKNQIDNIGSFNSIANVLPQLFAGNLEALLTIPPSVNIYDPQTVAYEHATNYYDSPPFYRDVWEYDNLGLNFQNAIDIPSMNLHVLLGLRYASSGANTILGIEQDGSEGTPFGPDTDKSKWIPRVGVTYDISDDHSVYTSYGESFKPPFTSAKDRNGNAITAPETGEQLEFGWRGSYFSGSLTSTLSIYELTKNNVGVPTVDPNIMEVAGEQRSRGLELDVVGDIGEYWNVYFSYAYTDTEVVNAGEASLDNGSRFAAIPLHKAVLWNNFSMDWTGFEGFDIGYGLDYSSDILTGAVDITTLSFNNVPTSGQGVVHNLSFGYRFETSAGDVELDLAVNNVFDRFYVQNTSNTIFATRGQSRNVLLSAKWQF